MGGTDPVWRLVMKKLIGILFLLLVITAPEAQALDPVAPRGERKYGMVYIETPNKDDKIVLESQRGEKDQKISSLKDVQIKVGDYLVKVTIKPDYTYEQPITVRPTERHEVIVPGFGNMRVNGKCKEVLVLQEGKKVTKLKCGEIRTLPRGIYDLKIIISKRITLDQTIAVVTNTLREVDVRR